jgi:hypothetical protein
LLGLAAWDVGQPLMSQTAGSAAPITVYQYPGMTLEFLGRMITCPINLTPLPPSPLWMGLFGRDHVFDQFGFGFWESAREIYVTMTP